MTSIIRFLFGLYFLLLRLVGGKSVGARALVLSPDRKKVLLVYHTYCPRWHLPGGGVKRKEHPVDAVQREIYEEAGIRCLEPPLLFGIYYQKYRHADDYPLVYIVSQWVQEKVTSPEIKDCQWFYIHALPYDMDPGSRSRIEEYCFGSNVSLYWNPQKNEDIK